MNPFTKLKAYLRLREAIKKADAAHAANGQRFYVIPAQDRQLVVIDKQNMKRLRQKHYLHPNFTTHDLIRTCFYHTPYSNGEGAISPLQANLRRSFYYKWYAESAKSKKP